MAPTNINNAQTSLNCALECGLHELISGRKKKKRHGELEVIAARHLWRIKISINKFLLPLGFLLNVRSYD